MNSKFFNIKIIITGMLSIMLFVTGCEDDSIWDGTDYYLASFQIELNATTYKATISSDSITISVPENVSLDGAVATVEMSENATISPDPSGITNWNEKHTFTITAYNGDSQTYYYSVVQTSVTGSGNIILTTQDEVEAFAAQGITELQGSLIIGANEGENSISSLESLSGLKIITSGLVINPTFSGTSLSGLENLEQVGSIEIGAVTKLQKAAFPALKSIMSDLSVTSSGIDSLEFPVLENVDNTITLSKNDSLVLIDFSSLKTVASDFTIQGKSNAKLSSISMPVLEYIYGNLSLKSLPNLISVSFASLTELVSCSVNSLTSLESFSAPKLETTYGNLYFELPALITLDMSSLTTVGGYLNMYSSTQLTGLEGLKSLKTVAGQLYLYNLTAVEKLDGLSALVSVGSLTLYNMSSLSGLGDLSSLSEVETLTISGTSFQSLSELSSLQSLQTLEVNGSNIEGITELDVSKFEDLEYLRVNNIYNSVAIKGPENFEGTLYLYQTNFELDGFNEVKTLSLSGFNSSSEITDKEIGTKKVTGDFTLSLSNISGTFNLPNLEEVGGKLNLNGRVPISMPRLKSVGEFYSKQALPEGGTYSFPSLETVDGDCYICTKISWGYWDEIQMPELKTVTGTLTVSGYSSSRKNTTLTNLNGFSSLTNAGGITIQYNTALTDYSGLKNAISSFTTDHWTVTGNAYNPTCQDLVDGKWTSED